MKYVLPVALLALTATAASAQERAAVVEPVRAEAPAATATAPAAVTATPAETSRTAESVVLKSRFESVKTAPAVESAAVQTVPRNFWWLVGGIVLAGVILALLL